MVDAPVGTCPHQNIAPSPMQNPAYREGDDGWIYYHGWDASANWCGLPEPWRYRHYLRYCGGCGRKFSNPWVPVCESCWDESGPYPSWSYVIELERQRREAH